MQQELFSGMTTKANAEGFVVVHPEGLGASWNAGPVCCSPSNTNMVDDVGFIAAMLDAITADLCIDPRRIYATGMSNGGYMSYRLACELSGRLAAVGPVAGAVGITNCNPTRKIPVIAFHGTLDSLVSFASDQMSIAGWVTRNGCNATPMNTFAKGDSSCDTYTCPENSTVTFCTVQDGGHTWPGSAIQIPVGKTTLDLVATDAMWAFFKAHPMP
jgi:polyhydroxybutyrate depolymerase